ncbi:MAG: efflux RND transporter permease subunit [Planctomycetes bacterium]|nr:efflux RND transporter permease subunit [Planctomycetota bacterium]
MFSQFFITRPRFAMVLSIVLVLGGLVSMFTLPVAQYPEIAPPQVKVTAIYPGASAQVLEDTVAAPIETQVNGAEDMLYMSSTSTSDGRYTLTVTFEVGTDIDIAAVDVQNRVALATSQLPEEVTRQGVSVQKQSSDMLLVISLFSPDRTYDQLFLSNYVSTHVLDVLARVPGVGSASIFGALDYGMRVWIDPERMAGFGLTTADLAAAIRDQNVQAAAGQIGQAPSSDTQQLQYTVRAKGRLSDVKEFEDIVLRANQDGSVLRLGDVARVELGARSYGSFGLLDGREAINFAVFQRPGANALDVAEGVRTAMADLSTRFPPGVSYQVVYDTTRFITASLEELTTTLFITVVLVVLVVYVFLQDWRSTLVPALAVPVSLVGTFVALQALGFSINTITLFGLVLAIGIVVDDAIVVIENVQRHMDDGLPAVEATRVAMREVTGPVIATTLVLLAVFVPVAFLSGITGQLYRQFAVTISVSVAISSFNALTLSPALCATILRSGDRKPWFALRAFNAFFERATSSYLRSARGLLRRLVLAGVILLGITVGTVALASSTSKSFVPTEDQGVILMNVQLPDGASLERTDEVMRRIDQELLSIPGVKDSITIRGTSLLSGGASNVGLGVAVLAPWEERDTPALSQEGILAEMWKRFGALPGATIIPFVRPAIRGLGNTGGFELQLQDTAARTPQELAEATRAFTYEANQDPRLAKVFSTFRADVPQIGLDLDREHAKMLDVDVGDVFGTLQAYLGGQYVNDFNRGGRVYQVIIQAEDDFRDDAGDIGRLYVRSGAGRMVPLRSLTSTRSQLGPESLSRFNMFRAATVNGSAAAGVSSGDALEALEETAGRVLPGGMTLAWSGMSLQEKRTGDEGTVVLLLGMLFVYLFLVAQYESWAIPAAVLLVIPIALGGAFVAAAVTRSSLDLYMQIGLVMLVGLSTKQAVLMVEFAMQQREAGRSIEDSAAAAAHLRFRAVMMTALTFVLGVLPLLVASGAGAAARRSLGTAVFGGMLAAALFGTLFVPAFYAMIETLRSRGGRAAPRDGGDA